MLAAERPAIAITYSPPDEPVRAIRRLQTPSLIAVVCVSQYFLELARGVLAPAIGRRHSMRGYLLAGDTPDQPGSADLVLCDVMTHPVVRPRYKAAAVFVHRLISVACLDQISAVMESRSTT